MRSTYRVLAQLVAIGVVLQVAFIAFAWFDVLSAVDDGQAFADFEDDSNVGHLLHSIGGTVIPLLGLALLVVSFFAKIPGGVKWAAIVFGVVVLQFVLAIVAFSAPVIGALHGVNALVLAGVADQAARRAKQSSPTGSGRPQAGARVA